MSLAEWGAWKYAYIGDQPSQVLTNIAGQQIKFGAGVLHYVQSQSEDGSTIGQPYDVWDGILIAPTTQLPLYTVRGRQIISDCSGDVGPMELQFYTGLVVTWIPFPATYLVQSWCAYR